MSIAVPLNGFGTGGNNQVLINVVGGLTQPENPKYGTIWIRTSTPVNGWEVFPVTPAWEAEEGHVYIQNVPATDGNIPNFAALDYLRKPYGTIWLRLSGAMQRVNGAWVRQDAWVWRDNVWTQFSSVFSATINITYPAGSTCTCSDGTTTLTAPNTSGTWACVVPNAGTWTVSSTSGTESDSKIVSITTDGQSVSVELSYALFLFKPNDACEDVTGGWSVDTTAESVTYGDELVIESVNYYNGTRTEEVHTNNQIDMTAYRTLQATCKASGGSDTKLEVYNGSTAVASAAIGTELTTVTVDISALSGLHSIGFGGRHSAYLTITYTSTEIKLLK